MNVSLLSIISQISTKLVSELEAEAEAESWPAPESSDTENIVVFEILRIPAIIAVTRPAFREPEHLQAMIMALLHCVELMWIELCRE